MILVAIVLILEGKQDITALCFVGGGTVSIGSGDERNAVFFRILRQTLVKSNLVGMVMGLDSSSLLRGLARQALVLMMLSEIFRNSAKESRFL